ncbi:MAG: DUF3299 domain-containing protein [Chloroherpetonaceae bacterium]|nr:DUF3299 domain-containing protein [Chloroherpetonaceae bacterium]
MFKSRLSFFGLFIGLLSLNFVATEYYNSKSLFVESVSKVRNHKATLSFDETPLAIVENEQPIGASFRITFNDLREYKYNRRGNSKVPDKLKGLEGKEVEIAGYMIPMNEAMEVREFMLVQIPFFGCCYSVPPEPNETIMIRMEKGKSTEYVYTPIRVKGKFKISETKIDDFVVSIYQMEASDVKAATADDKDVIQHQQGSAIPVR